MTTNHEQGFRPSHFPRLEECVHHESKEAPSEAKERGTNTHFAIAKVFKESVDATTPETIWAYDLVWGYRKQDWKVFSVEQGIEILDECGNVITTGTLDLVLERNREYLIIDWKTGDRNDYGAQLAAYQAAWWDLHPEATRVGALVAYVDLRETESLTQSFAQSSLRVLALYSKWKTKEAQPYVINAYCSWCGRRGECPAWRSQSAAALSAVAELSGESVDLAPLVEAKVDSIKNNPATLEKFVIAWERTKTLVEDEWGLKDALKTHMQTGYKAEHFNLVTVSDKSEIVKSCDSEQYLLTVVKQLGTMQAAQAIKVDPDKALEVWKSYFSDAEFPLKVKETIVPKAGYSYIREKGKLGQGTARRKRKELE